MSHRAAFTPNIPTGTAPLVEAMHNASHQLASMPGGVAIWHGFDSMATLGKGFARVGSSPAATEHRYELIGGDIKTAVLGKVASLLTVDYLHQNIESIRGFVKAGSSIDLGAALTEQLSLRQQPDSAEWFMHTGHTASGQTFAAESLLFLTAGASEPMLSYTAFRDGGESPKVTEILRRRGGLLACVMTSALDGQMTIRDSAPDTITSDPLMAAAPDVVDIDALLEGPRALIREYDSLGNQLEALRLHANLEALNATYGLRGQAARHLPTADELVGHGTYLSSCLAA